MMCGILFIFSILSATTYFVKTPADGGNDSNSGLSWINAKATLQSAIDSSAEFDEILVKYGTYNITTNITLTSDRKISSDDGNGTCFDDAEPACDLCVIDANYNDTVWEISHVTNNTTVKGFKITKGYGDGAGLYIHTWANLIIEYCWITENKYETASESWGAGIYIYNASPTIQHNLITHNEALGDGYGGGIYSNFSNPTIVHNVFYENYASYGSGINFSGDYTIIRNNIFMNHNLPGSDGTAIHNSGNYITVNNNCFYNNLDNLDSVYSNDEVLADPKFTDAGNDDFTLSYDSPCIEAGFYSLIYDENENHEQGWIEDIGAYEYSGNRIKKYISGNGEVIFGGNVRAKINITNLNTLSALDIFVHPNESHPQIPGSVKRWYEIIPTGEVGGFDLTLSYKDSELNGINENHIKFYRWDEVSLEGPISVNPVHITHNWVKAEEQSDFSDWILWKNPPQTDDVPGDALAFDGVDDHILINSNSYLRPANNFTIEAWIKPAVLSGTQCIIDHDENGGGDDGYIIQLNENIVRFLPLSGSLQYLDSDEPVILNQWNHLVCVYENSMMKVYVNGIEKTLQGSGDIVYEVTNHINLGRRGGTALPNTQMFTGQIEEVRFWNTAVSSEKIREYMHLPLIGSEIGLIGYWQFNEGSGTVLEDKISGNDGTLTNMTEDDWIDSTIPFGTGVSDTQIETAGTVDFTDIGLSMYFNSHNSAEITVTRINTTANINPTEPDEVFDAQYWVVNRFGIGIFNADLTFTVSEDLTTEDEANPSRISLFTRASTADTTWIHLLDASSVSAANNEATFDGITEFSQFIIGRWIQFLDIPQNVICEIIGTEVQLSWDTISGANSYKIYASDDPYAADWGTEVASVSETSWSAVISEDKKFYRVVASSESVRGRVLKAKNSKVADRNLNLNEHRK